MAAHIMSFAALMHGAVVWLLQQAECLKTWGDSQYRSTSLFRNSLIPKLDIPKLQAVTKVFRITEVRAVASALTGQLGNITSSASLKCIRREGTQCWMN
jgi:hypothetical protein